MTDKITNEDLAPILVKDDPEFRALVERQMIERCATLCDKKAAHAKLHGGAQNGALMAQMLADDIRALGDD